MRQRWGQNFLVRTDVAKRIVAALSLSPEDAVLEIGPGRGILTQEVVGNVKNLALVEIDKNLAEGLSRRWGARPDVSIICSNFLDWTPPQASLPPYKILANLPYSMGTAILQKLLAWGGWNTAVVMLQKEVARRIAAKPGGADYGVLTLAVQSRARVQPLFDVSRRAFKPAPLVTSTVFSLEKYPNPIYIEEAAFFQTIKAAFSQRRKTIHNTLSSGFDMEKSTVAELLEKLKIQPTLRPQEITLAQYCSLADLISRKRE